MKYRIKQTAKERFIVEKLVSKTKGHLWNRKTYKEWESVKERYYIGSIRVVEAIPFETMQAAKDYIEEQKVNYPIYHELK